MTEYQPPLFPDGEGRWRRDEGLNKVSGHNSDWIEGCITFFSMLNIEGDFTGEDIRQVCKSAFLEPTHPNAWGALTKVLIQRNIIRFTGKYRQMKDPTSHARRTPVYDRVATK